MRQRRERRKERRTRSIFFERPLGPCEKGAEEDQEFSPFFRKNSSGPVSREQQHVYNRGLFFTFVDILHFFLSL